MKKYKSECDFFLFRVTCDDVNLLNFFIDNAETVWE